MAKFYRAAAFGYNNRLSAGTEGPVIEKVIDYLRALLVRLPQIWPE